MSKPKYLVYIVRYSVNGIEPTIQSIHANHFSARSTVMDMYNEFYKQNNLDDKYWIIEEWQVNEKGVYYAKKVTLDTRDLDKIMHRT